MELKDFLIIIGLFLNFMVLLGIAKGIDLFNKNMDAIKHLIELYGNKR